MYVNNDIVCSDQFPLCNDTDCDELSICNETVVNCRKMFTNGNLLMILIYVIMN